MPDADVVDQNPLGAPLAELLDGQTIALTGVTGFIGEQLLWRVLTAFPNTPVVALVRPKGSVTAVARVHALLRKPIFKQVVEAAGGVEKLQEGRITVVSGDLPDVPELPRGIDVFVHCAGDVSFDPLIDEAFLTNVIGTSTLMTRFIESASDANGELERIPHFVYISTAYTAGRRRGPIPEASHEHSVDYKAETKRALALREFTENQSRTSERLTKLRRQAEKLHRQAGFLTTSQDTEQRRTQWVRQELITAGTERARSLGWTDCYTFAKAMGERAVEDLGASIRVSVVRPAIVESSLVAPYPGWIEGFKMADPIILAYGRGQLREFPASPDAVIDLIPCDYVVNAIIAACATTPEVGKPRYYHVSSGARNPLTFRGIYEQIRKYFTAHPYADGQGAIRLPVWNFPGADPVIRLLALLEMGQKVGNAVLARAPRGKQVRKLAAKLDAGAKQLEFLNKYLTLYGEYLQSELHFVDDATLALHRSLDPADAAEFGFDSASVDWDYYLQEVHTPAITNPVRRLEAARKKRAARSATFKPLKPAQPGTVLAAFDLDGTVMATNVIETYLWTRLPELSPLGRLRELGSVVGHLPAYLGAERRDRGVFLRSVYRRYQGADLAALEQFVDDEMAPFVLDRMSPDAIRRIREHRAAGHTTVLITGVIRPLTRPLAGLFDVIVAADLATDEEGRCTGFLTGPPMVGDSRAAWLAYYANQTGIDLSKSYAYADSHVDLPMLRAVGLPVAVSPDVALARAAKASAWSVVDWPAQTPIPRWKMPS